VGWGGEVGDCGGGTLPWSKSSPRAEDDLVLLACLPSTLSKVEYRNRPAANLIQGGKRGRGESELSHVERKMGR